MAIEERKPPLAERQVENMLIVLIRKDKAFNMARRQLTASSFADHHQRFSALWTAVCDHYDEFNSLPSEEDVLGSLERQLQMDPEMFSEDEGDLLDQFIEKAYTVDPDLLDQQVVRVAFKFLRAYLEERLTARIRQEVTVSTYTPADLCSLLNGYREEAMRVATVEPTGLNKPFPKGWMTEQSAVVKKSTGLPFFDHMLNGGQAEKEVYGLLGPTGSCKTTIAIQYATTQADMWRREWVQTRRKGVLKTVYMFIYESDVAEMRLRCLSCFGGIDRDTLESENYWNKLSTNGQYKPYERAMYEKALARGVPVLCERERFVMSQRCLNVNLRIVDMTGNDPDHPGRGWGLIDEVQQIIEADQDSQRQEGINAGVGPIILDYAGAAVERHLDQRPSGSNNKDDKLHLISNYGMQCKNKLAIRFRTQVLALHQLRGVANAYASGHMPKSSEAMGCSTWPTNLDFSFVIGTPNAEAFAGFMCDKHRRAPGSENIVIQLRGAISKVEFSPTHTLDKATNSIVKKEDVRSIIEHQEGAADHSPRQDRQENQVNNINGTLRQT